MSTDNISPTIGDMTTWPKACFSSGRYQSAMVGDETNKELGFCFFLKHRKPSAIISDILFAIIERNMYRKTMKAFIELGGPLQN